MPRRAAGDVHWKLSARQGDCGEWRLAVGATKVVKTHKRGRWLPTQTNPSLQTMSQQGQPRPVGKRIKKKGGCRYYPDERPGGRSGQTDDQSFRGDSLSSERKRMERWRGKGGEGNCPGSSRRDAKESRTASSIATKNEKGPAADWEEGVGRENSGV